MGFEGPVELTHSTERPFQLVDVTEGIAETVAGWSIDAGSVTVYCPHTSCGLLVTEMEDGLHEDIEALLDRLAPSDGTYAHDDMERRYQNLGGVPGVGGKAQPDERKNGWSHLRGALVTQPSLTLPIADGAVALGQWQRVFLVELDGPRPKRRVAIHGVGRRRT